jgi:hypothetical protein
MLNCSQLELFSNLYSKCKLENKSLFQIQNQKFKIVSQNIKVLHINNGQVYKERLLEPKIHSSFALRLCTQFQNLSLTGLSTDLFISFI